MIGNLLTSLFLAFCVGIGTYQADRTSRNLSALDDVNVYRSVSRVSDQLFVDVFQPKNSWADDLQLINTPSQPFTGTSIDFYYCDFDGGVDGTGSYNILTTNETYVNPFNYIDDVYVYLKTLSTDFDFGYLHIHSVARRQNTTAHIYYVIPFLNVQSIMFLNNNYEINAIEFSKFGDLYSDGYHPHNAYLYNSNLQQCSTNFTLDTAFILSFGSFIASSGLTTNNYYANANFAFSYQDENREAVNESICELRFLCNFNLGDSSYQVGFQNGYTKGLGEGYNNGYRDGLAVSSNATFTGLMNSIADTPLRFLYGLFNFDLFGTSVLIVIMSLLTGIIVFGVVKKFWR